MSDDRAAAAALVAAAADLRAAARTLVLLAARFERSPGIAPLRAARDLLNEAIDAAEAALEAKGNRHG